MADHKNEREGMKQEQSNRERPREERKYFLLKQSEGQWQTTRMEGKV